MTPREARLRTEVRRLKAKVLALRRVIAGDVGPVDTWELAMHLRRHGGLWRNDLDADDEEETVIAQSVDFGRDVFAKPGVRWWPVDRHLAPVAWPTLPKRRVSFVDEDEGAFRRRVTVWPDGRVRVVETDPRALEGAAEFGDPTAWDYPPPPPLTPARTSG